MNSRSRLLIILLVLLAAPVFAAGPSSFVTDRAGVIDDRTERALAGALQELEQKTGAQMLVLTVDSTEGIPIEQYALETAERWGLGRKDRDDGLLFVVAIQDRRYRIEVGYGLEGLIPDSLAGTIARQELVPRFKQGDYTGGITYTAAALMETIARDKGVELTGLPELQRRKSSGGFPAGLAIVIAIILINGLTSRRRYSRWSGTRTRHGGIWYMGGGGFGSSGGSGGGFGSFGGGGFGGFGGGGASGGW